MALIDSMYFSGSLDPLTTGALKHFNYKDVVLVTPCKTMIPKTHYLPATNCSEHLHGLSFIFNLVFCFLHFAGLTIEISWLQ